MSDGYLISTDGGLDLSEAEKFYREPKLGEKVYYVNVDGKEIYEYEVYAKGKDFFLPNCFKEMRDEYQKVRFSEYNSKWYDTLDEAKECLLFHLDDEYEIVEGDEGWWYAARL